jgi:hypothetical protein
MQRVGLIPRWPRMAIDIDEHDPQSRQTPSREVLLSKLFTRATTAVFLAICGAAAAVALGYTPLLAR